MFKISRPDNSQVFNARTFVRSFTQKFCKGLFIHEVACIYQNLFDRIDARLHVLKDIKANGMLSVMGAVKNYSELKNEEHHLHDLRNELVHEVIDRFGLNDCTDIQDEIRTWMIKGISSKAFMENQSVKYQIGVQNALDQLEAQVVTQKEFKQQIATLTKQKVRTKSFIELKNLFVNH